MTADWSFPQRNLSPLRGSCASDKITTALPGCYPNVAMGQSPLLGKEGWMRPLIKLREASLAGADGVVRSSHRVSVAEPTTPPAPLIEAAPYRACAPRKGGFATFLLMSRPPLLF